MILRSPICLAWRTSSLSCSGSSMVFRLSGISTTSFSSSDSGSSPLLSRMSSSRRSGFTGFPKSSNSRWSVLLRSSWSVLSPSVPSCDDTSTSCRESSSGLSSSPTLSASLSVRDCLYQVWLPPMRECTKFDPSTRHQMKQINWCLATHYGDFSCQ